MKPALTGILFAVLTIGVCYSQDVERGVELYRKGDYSQAESQLRRAVEQQSDNARATMYLGLTLLEQNKINEAEPLLKKAAELESSGEAKAALARLYIEQKQYDRAEELLRDASGPEVSYARGLLAFHRDRHEEAVRELESHLESHPEHAYAHYYAGMAYSSLRRPDKMLTHFEQFLRLKPDAPEARKVRSVLRSVR